MMRTAIRWYASRASGASRPSARARARAARAARDPEREAAIRDADRPLHAAAGDDADPPHARARRRRARPAARERRLGRDRRRVPPRRAARHGARRGRGRRSGRSPVVPEPMSRSTPYSAQFGRSDRNVPATGKRAGGAWHLGTPSRCGSSASRWVDGERHAAVTVCSVLLVPSLIDARVTIVTCGDRAAPQRARAELDLELLDVAGLE